jgi:serine/threonine-protein kinase RsbT
MEAHELETTDDIIRARQLVRGLAVSLGFGIVDQTKLITAASELARNAVIHGGGGRMVMESLASEHRTGIRLRFEDDGPGIPDLELAMRDGYTTRGGLGHGLGGARRLVNEFEVKTQVGQGTQITITKWK